jgi:hypothetical protein
MTKNGKVAYSSFLSNVAIWACTCSVYTAMDGTNPCRPLLRPWPIMSSATTVIPRSVNSRTWRASLPPEDTCKSGHMVLAGASDFVVAATAISPPAPEASPYRGCSARAHVPPQHALYGLGDAMFVETDEHLARGRARPPRQPWHPFSLGPRWATPESKYAAAPPTASPLPTSTPCIVLLLWHCSAAPRGSHAPPRAKTPSQPSEKMNAFA